MTSISRRALLQGSAAMSAAAVLQVPLVFAASAGDGAAGPLELPFLRIGADGKIVALLPTTEMGQGTRTGQLMILAEELGVPLDAISAEMPSQPSDPYRVKFGALMRMRSVGSWGIRFFHDPMRKAAAKARAVLIAAAAQQLGVPAAELDTRDGGVVHAASGKSVPFGALVAEASKLPLPDDPPLRADPSRTLTGTAAARVDIPAKVDGSARFGVDMVLPDMLHGAVRLAPVWSADVASLDESSALTMPGVVAVVKVPRGAVVIGKTWWQAKRAADALAITFTATAHDAWSSAKHSADMRAGLDAADALPVMAKGDLAAARASAAQSIAADYEVPMLAHVCMEPVVCTARVAADRVDMWLPTQDHDSAVEAAAGAAGVTADRVFIETPFLGGGFGRKGQTDIVVEAVLASKAVGGKPVKVMWSRDDDVQQGYYRPAMTARFSGSLDKDGNVVALECRLSGPQMGRQYKHVTIKDNLDPFTIGTLHTHKYAIANQVIIHKVIDAPVPLSPWRAVSSTQNGFFLECFIDELATAAGVDPLAFRRRMLTGAPRHLAVLDKVAALSGWATPPPEGRYRGVAIYECYGSVAAHVVEISIVEGRPKVHRVSVAIDCGRAINPNSVAAQMEGSVIEALGATLDGRIDVVDGRAANSNLDTYRLPRIADAPERIDTGIVEIGSPLGGVGEPGGPPLAPALCNAIFAATGKRIRTLPIGDQLA